MICENCGKEHNGNYGSGRFCSIECAKSFSTKNIKKEYKEAKCINCGKIIYIHKQASNKNCKCNDCTNYYKRISTLKKEQYKRYIICPICGQKHLIYEKCSNNFCKIHNKQQFKSLIKYFGFDKSKLGTLEVENEFNRIRDLLYDLYWNKQLSSKEICNKFNYPNTGNLIGKIFKYLDIKSKNLKQAINENIDIRHYNPIDNFSKYQECYHITWNKKEVYLRSSYELDYAKNLDNQKVDYEVESLRIKYFDTQLNKFRQAIPDFYIPSINTIVEIKSTWTLDIQNMKDKMKAYKDLNYNFKLICDHKELQI